VPRFVAVVAVAAALGFVTGCSGTENPSVYAYECEREAPGLAGATSLADALAQQAAINKAYRQCIDKRSVRAAH
jgi:hypothetical protein